MKQNPKGQSRKLELIVALITASVAIINMFTTGVHGIYSSYALIILGTATVAYYFGSDVGKSKIPTWITLIGITTLIVLMIIPWSSIISFAYTGTPYSALLFIIWMIFVTTSAIYSHATIESTVGENQGVDITLRYIIAITYVVLGWYVATLGSVVTLALVSTRAAKAVGAFAAFIYGIGIALAGFEITLLKDRANKPSKYDTLRYAIIAISFIVGGLIMRLGHARLFEAALEIACGLVLIVAAAYGAKTKKKAHLFTKYATTLALVTIPYLFLFLGNLMNINYAQADCTANIATYGRKVLIYGPQELIIHTSDGNTFVVKPWHKLVLDKNTFCESKYYVITTFGRAPCKQCTPICGPTTTSPKNPLKST